MTEPVVAQKGSYTREMEPGTYWWCACGRSGTQPFCDGSHKGTGIDPVETTVSEKKKIAWCGCKRSANKPFCDGAHRALT